MPAAVQYADVLMQNLVIVLISVVIVRLRGLVVKAWDLQSGGRGLESHPLPLTHILLSGPAVEFVTSQRVICPEARKVITGLAESTAVVGIILVYLSGSFAK